MEQSPASLLLGPRPPQRDLVRELQTQQRRRLLRRAGILAALALVLFLLGLGLKTLADGRSVARALDTARSEFALGTPEDLDECAEGLVEELAAHADDPELRGALAVTRAQEWAEFGVREDEARAAVAAVAELDTHDAVLARGLLALGDGDLDAAEAAREALPELEDGRSIAPGHEIWIQGMLALARVMPDETQLAAAIDEVREHIAGAEAAVCHRRLLAALLMRSGAGDEALEELDAARKQSQLHNGLAADEALYNAALRQRLGGVASVSEQLLLNADTLTPLARERAGLARAMVRLQAGDRDAGVEGLERAWERLPAWDRISRELALELAMEAGEGALVLGWLEGYDLPDEEVKIYEAWADLQSGDVMRALDDLAQLPQAHRRVAYLQGLALVEQRRHSEAMPWLERADRLIPGRAEVEVARARAEVFTADAEAARRKLEGLTEEAAWAPRAWTGLGEARARLGALAEAKQPGKGGPDFEAARAAFEKAVERERLPAEATARLAEMTALSARDPAKGDQEALALYRKAVEINPTLPRYEELLFEHLAYVGFVDEAIERGRTLVERDGITGPTFLHLAELEIWRADRRAEAVPAAVAGYLEQAEKLGVPTREVAVARARATLVEGNRSDAEQVSVDMGALLDADEAFVDARLVYVDALLRMRELDQAKVSVRRGLGLGDPARHGELLLAWADIDTRNKKYGLAAAHARSAFSKLEEAGGSPRLMIEAGGLATRSYIKLKKKRPVMSSANALVERVPYHVDSWINLARAHLAGKETAEARAAIEKAIEVDPGSAPAHEFHGHVLLRFGLRDDARAAYEKAVSLVAGTPEEADYRKHLERL